MRIQTVASSPLLPCSRKATACSRLTVGKSSKNSSNESPPSKESISVRAGRAFSQNYSSDKHSPDSSPAVSLLHLKHHSFAAENLFSFSRISRVSRLSFLSVPSMKSVRTHGALPSVAPSQNTWTMNLHWFFFAIFAFSCGQFVFFGCGSAALCSPLPPVHYSRADRSSIQKGGFREESHRACGDIERHRQQADARHAD